MTVKGKEGEEDKKRPQYGKGGATVGEEDPKTRIFTDNPELNSGIVGFGLGLGGALLAGALLDNARRNQNPCDHYHYRDVAHDQLILYCILHQIEFENNFITNQIEAVLLHLPQVQKRRG